MAFFASLAHEDDPQRAVRCALLMESDQRCDVSKFLIFACTRDRNQHRYRDRW
jgi:hypothetical protein